MDWTFTEEGQSLRRGRRKLRMKPADRKYRERTKRRFLDVEKENMKLVGATEEDGRGEGRQLTVGCEEFKDWTVWKQTVLLMCL